MRGKEIATFLWHAAMGRTAECPLPGVYCLLSGAYCLLCNVGCLLSTVWRLLSVIGCRVSIAYCLVSVAHCLVAIVHCLMSSVCCTLPALPTSFPRYWVPPGAGFYPPLLPVLPLPLLLPLASCLLSDVVNGVGVALFPLQGAAPLPHKSLRQKKRPIYSRT